MNSEFKVDEQMMWLEFINARTDKDFDKLKSYNDPTMNKAIDALSKLSDDPKVREMVQIREDAMHEESSCIAYAKRKAEKRGEKRGIRLGKKQSEEKINSLNHEKEQLNH